jgi:hypothetical protein
VNTNTSNGQPRPLPIRPRPATGESTVSYIRRLARANHLRPNYLRRYLRDPDHGGIRLDWLAILAGRPVDSLERALADPRQCSLRSSPARRSGRTRDKTVLLATLRRDAYERGQSIRAISDRHGVGRRTVLQALESPIPRPRKKLPPRKSRLDPFKDAIDDILRQDLDKPHRSRRTVKTILDELTTQHGMVGVSYSTVRGYVAHRRSLIKGLPSPTPRYGPDLSWSPCHQAVEHEDLPQLRDLLNAGHDIEDDNGDGRSLLHYAIDVEYGSHIQTGEPLRATVTAFLLARGANPLRQHNNTTAVEKAETCGHWLAAEIMRAWTDRDPRSGSVIR